MSSVWDKLGQFTLEVLREEMAKAQNRFDYFGTRKDQRYRLNNTGNFSKVLGYQVIEEYGETDILITYPDVAPYKYQAPIFFETGRRPGRGVPPLALRQWAGKKVNGFNTLSESRKNSFLYFTQMKIKNRGIGGLQIFGTLNQKVLDEFDRFINSLSEEEILQLPDLQEINEVLERIQLIDLSSAAEL
jgi:hypothetical protein